MGLRASQVVYYRGKLIEKYVLLLLWNNFQINTKLIMEGQNFKISKFYIQDCGEMMDRYI